MPPGGAAGDAPSDRSEHNGQQDVQEVGEGRKEGRRQTGRCEGRAPKSQPGEVVLLSGGNPQIAKGYGDAPVQAYIAAMPGWKSDLGRRLDALIERTVPGVRKAVKWNSPFYGVEDDVWFLSLHCFTKYVEGDLLPRHVAASCPARRVQAQGGALPRHPRGPARRSSVRRLGEASQPIARRTNVSGRSRVGDRGPWQLPRRGGMATADAEAASFGTTAVFFPVDPAIGNARAAMDVVRYRNLAERRPA